MAACRSRWSQSTHDAWPRERSFRCSGRSDLRSLPAQEAAMSASPRFALSVRSSGGPRALDWQSRAASRSSCRVRPLLAPVHREPESASVRRLGCRRRVTGPVSTMGSAARVTGPRLMPVASRARATRHPNLVRTNAVGCPVVLSAWGLRIATARGARPCGCSVRRHVQDGAGRCCQPACSRATLSRRPGTSRAVSAAGRPRAR